MKFIVQFQIKPGLKNRLLEAFESQGPSRNPGVTFRGAWIGAHADVAFVLAESENESQVESAAKAWGEYGKYVITPVLDIEQF